MHITGDKYPRNYLLFNVAFVFAADANVASAEPIVRELCLSFNVDCTDRDHIDARNDFPQQNNKQHARVAIDSRFSILSMHAHESNVIFDALITSATPHIYNTSGKLAESLRSLEVDSGYIIGDGKQQLEWVLKEVREQLNRDGQADVTISPGNTLRLRMPPLREVQPLVAQHEVPVPLVDFSRAPVDRLDWAIAELLPHIDGVACAKAIALRSGVR